MDEDEWREAAIAAAGVTHSNMHSSKITQDRLNKLEELRRRRLQIKAKSKKIQKNLKGAANVAAKASEMELSIEDGLNEHTAITQEGSSLHVAKGHSCLTGPQVETASSMELKKRQKLHWGLDTKERWERKANM
ncbi:hypothetical protein AAC387_Pa09g0585 [Persea americana]